METLRPTWEEIQRWKERLDDRNFQRRWLSFQAHVHRMFEGLRMQTGLQLIRAIICRDEIKSLDSIVEKITRKREEGKAEEVSVRPNLDSLPGNLREKINYDESPKSLIFVGVMTSEEREQLKSLFDTAADEEAIDRLFQKRQRLYDLGNIRDLVGIKILCPYKEDTHKVAEWLFTQTDHVRVIEQNPKAGRRDDPSGYKGYNFMVYPPIGASPSWATVYCEVQIKTLIEEAWDAKTHDLSHKMRRAIPEKHHRRFKKLSDLLSYMEDEGEEVRQDIEEIFEEVKAHREVVAKKLLAQSLDYLNELREKYPKLPVIDADPRLSAAELKEVNEALRSEWTAGKNSVPLSFGSAYIALCTRDPGQASFALQLADDLAINDPHDPGIELARACAYWSLARFSRSVECCRAVLRKCEGFNAPREKLDGLKSDYCYYITDATLFFTYVPPDMLKSVRELMEEVRVGPTATKASTQDTVGFVKIVLGTTREEVQEGIESVERGLQAARGTGDSLLIQMAEAFCSRHLRLGHQRLQDYSS